MAGFNPDGDPLKDYQNFLNEKRTNAGKSKKNIPVKQGLKLVVKSQRQRPVSAPLQYWPDTVPIKMHFQHRDRATL